MRHAKKGRKLGVEKKVRTALLKSLARSLIVYGKIRTTEPRAKEIRPLVERLITKAKNNTLASRREAEKILEKTAVKKLFTEVAPRYEERRGGYTRILKHDKRKDGAQMVIMEFV